MTSTAKLETRPEPPKRRAATWRARLLLVLEVVLLVWLGMLLIVLPWSPLWTSNGLLVSHFALRQILASGWARGAVTGLGLVNVWIGIWDAVHYREH